jgi:hypothetical protein
MRSAVSMAMLIAMMLVGGCGEAPVPTQILINLGDATNSPQ